MELSVYSLKKVLFDGKAESLTCATTTGEITVLDHHEPLVTELAKGVLKIVDGERKEHYIPISSGFLETKSSATRILADE